jgi:hypothetical protein
VATFSSNIGIWYAKGGFVKAIFCTTQVQQRKRIDVLVFGMPVFIVPDRFPLLSMRWSVALP